MVRQALAEGQRAGRAGGSANAWARRRGRDPHRVPGAAAVTRIECPACRDVGVPGYGERVDSTAAQLAFVVFPARAGDCAIVWRTDTGAVVGSALPQGGAEQARRAVRRWYPGAVESEPTAPVAGAVERVTRLLDEGDDGPEGHPAPLARVELDLGAVPPFDRRVYEVVRQIPPGETLTYGEVAARLGAPGSAQAVGQALGRNPFPPIVPCHRVLAAGGAIGGFSARGGPHAKRRMLEQEGALVEEPTLFDL